MHDQGHDRTRSQRTININPEEKIDPIIICGTGRSGTSLAARILKDVGVFMGYTFIPANSANADGHCEDIEFISLCRELVTNNCNEDEWYKELIPLIERRYQKHVVWGFKAPIILDLVEYFTSLFPNAKWLIIIRKRSDVIQSCMKQYGWTEQQATAMHDTRMALKEEHLKDKNLLEIKFEKLIENSEMQIRRICEWANLEYSDDLTKLVKPERVMTYA